MGPTMAENGVATMRQFYDLFAAGKTDDAVAALSVKLSNEEAKSLEALYVPHAVAGFT